MKKVMRHLSILLLGAVMLSSCQEQQQMQTPPPAQYAMITTEIGTCNYSKAASATIRGRQDISILPQVAGTLTSIRVQEGDQVKRGETMFVIDQIPFRAAVKSAEAAVATAKASLATAELTLDSKKKLYESKVVSEFDYLTAQNAQAVAAANLAAQEALLVSAINNLSYTVVKSPADGVIGIIPYRVGALVSSATALTTVSDNSLMQVYFSINENDLLTLIRQHGSREKALSDMHEVSLKLSDASTYEEMGKIASMSGVIDRTTGSVTMRADFKNPKGLLHSGASGNVMMATKRDSVVVIPLSATYEIQDQVYVFQVVDGKAKSQPIKITRITDQNVGIVESGLAAGVKIVSEGVGLLREGTPIVEKGSAPAAAAAAPAAAEKK